MITLQKPISVLHRGVPIVFCEGSEPPRSTPAIYYNVLRPRIDVAADSAAWSGYQPLTFPPQTAPAGISLLRVERDIAPVGLLQAVSDQQYVYLLRLTSTTVLVNRYVMVEVPLADVKADTRLSLQPAWEVRFQRSGNADLSAGDKDSLSAKSPDGQPYLEPVYELPIDATGLQLGSAGLAALLEPVNGSDRLRWQIFICRTDTGRILTYSFERTEDGWFKIAPDQIDPATGVVAPDAEIALTFNGAPLAANGWLAACNYFKQEPVATDGSGVVKIKRTSRALLAAPVMLDGAARLATIDFTIATDGTLSGIEEAGRPHALTYEAGRVAPASFVLAFDGPASVLIPTDPPGKALVLPRNFTLEAWVYPSSKNLAAQVIIGGAGAALGDPQQPPAMWVINQLRISAGYGDGTTFTGATTRDNVLTLSTWNHVAVVSDASGMTIYINGTAAPLAAPAAPAGAPVAKPLTSIGGLASGVQLSVRGGTVAFADGLQDAFVGMLDEMRVWSKSLTASDIAEYLYHEIPADEARRLTELAAYWRLDDGDGAVATDLSAYGRDGRVSGASWLAQSAPVLADADAKIYLDARGLATYVGLPLPAADHPQFIDIAAATRPALLDGGDGLVHLYFEAADGAFSAAHYDAGIARAYYAFPWIAQSSDPHVSQTGLVSLIARRSGSALNHAVLTATIDPTGFLCDLTLNDGLDTTETWKGVPRRVAALAAILGGNAVGDPLLLAAGDQRPFYDYAGGRRVGLVPQDPLELGALWLLSNRVGAFELRQAKLDGIAGSTGTLSLGFASDAIHPSETLTFSVANVPTDAAAFVLTVAGKNGAFDYSLPGDPAAGKAYILLADPVALTILVPGSGNVTTATFTVAAGGDLAHCHLDATLTVQGRALAAAWSDLPRDVNGFVAGLLASTEPDQRAVVALLRFVVPPAGRMLDGASSASLLPVLTLLSAVNDGITGTLAAFTCNLAAIQGAGSTSASARLTLGSNLFAVVVQGAATNGYPAALSLGNAGQATALLASPGRDGGWRFEPPHFAVEIHPQGLLSAAVGTPSMLALDLVDAMTIESWARLNASTPTRNSYFPRLVHANLMQARDPTRYMLGLQAGHCLQIVQYTLVTAADSDTTDAAKTLFPNPDYSIQFYINPHLSTVRGEPSNVIFSRSTSAGSEALKISETGQVTYAITPTAGQAVTTPPIQLIDRTWQQITITRTGEQLVVYMAYHQAGQDGANAVPVITSVTLARPVSTAAAHTSLTVAGNNSPRALQAQMSTFAIWNRALTRDEVISGLNVPPAPAAPGLQMLWGLDGNPGDLSIPNVAEATEGMYDTKAQGDQTSWAYPGLFYRAFFGFGSLAVTTRYSVAAAYDWHGYAGVFIPHYGVNFTAGSFADCGNDNSLNFRNALSIEAWIKPDNPQSGGRQALVSKFGAAPDTRSYELGIDGGGHPYLTIRLDGLKTPSGDPALERDRVRTFTSPSVLTGGLPYYLAGTISIVSFADMADPLAPGNTVFPVVGQVYVDGQPTIDGPARMGPNPTGPEQTYVLSVIGGSGSGRYRKGAPVPIVASDPSAFTRWRCSASGAVGNLLATSTSVTMPGADVTVSAVAVLGQISISQSTTNLDFGRAPADGGGNYYQGGMSDVRLWAAALEPGVVAAVFATHAPPPTTQNLVSAYTFTEQQGMIAYDKQSNNNARLSSSRMWGKFQDGATMELYVDGRQVPVDPASLASFGPYGPDQFRVGGSRDDNRVYRNPFIGMIDEVRVWSQARTQEQIADSLHGYLVGNETDLAGYWSLSSGSGTIAADLTGAGNDLKFQCVNADAMPSWVQSTAPIGTEAPPVHDVLGGVKTASIATISEGPVAFEYGESQRDRRGNIFSVLKRGYAFVGSGQLQRYTGYKVGDLRTVHIGQVQTKPSLIGYMEGAPPLPSENLTRPFYKDPIAAYFQYDDIASVSLGQSAGAEVSISGSRSDSRGLETTITFGVGGGTTLLAGPVVPPAPAVLIQTVKLAWRAGVRLSITWSEESSKGSSIVQEYTRATSMEFSNGGDWAPDEVRLPSGERRYIPDNIGCAVVKSATADLYGLFLASTGALVSFNIVPNLDIPIDTNLIYFPIDPQYVNNGSLDGRVGLGEDPDPNAHGSPSYFRPKEAYALERSIERQTALLASWYEQVDAAGRARSQNADLSDLISTAPFYDWTSNVPRKNIVNKYVWTAAGGLYKEQEGYSSQRQESFGGSYDFDWRLGATGSIEGEVGPIGLFFEADLLGGTGWTVTVDKDKKASSAIDLEVELKPERCLLKYLDTGKAPFYSEVPVPGKVDTYRFMSFYIAPSRSNTDTFFNQVISPQWLAASPDPQAAALREAQAVSAGQSAWRILHRVTYVSRIPPPFQVVPDATAAPQLAPPVRLEDNAMFLALLARYLNDKVSPTPVEIGAAVTQLLGPGLTRILPWWADFLNQAARPNSDAANRLGDLRASMLSYAKDYYATLPAVR